MKTFKDLFFPRSFSGRVKGILTGSPKPLFAKNYIKSSLNVWKGWVKSEFSIKKFFFLNLIFCSHGIQFWKKCRKLLANSLTKILLKIRESKQKIDFSKESRQKRSSGHAGCGSQLNQKSFNQIEKKSIVQFLVFFQDVPLHRGSRCDNSTQCFLLRVKTWWKPENCFIQSTSSSKFSIGDDKWWLDNPANIVWMCDKVSHNVWKRQKNFIFRKKYNFLTLFHWTRKSSLRIVPQGFGSFLKEVTYMKTFKELFFPRSFSGRVEGTFDSLPETSFCQKLH